MLGSMKTLLVGLLFGLLVLSCSSADFRLAGQGEPTSPDVLQDVVEDAGGDEGLAEAWPKESEPPSDTSDVGPEIVSDVALDTLPDSVAIDTGEIAVDSGAPDVGPEDTIAASDVPVSATLYFPASGDTWSATKPQTLTYKDESVTGVRAIPKNTSQLYGTLIIDNGAWTTGKLYLSLKIDGNLVYRAEITPTTLKYIPFYVKVTPTTNPTRTLKWFIEGTGVCNTDAGAYCGYLLLPEGKTELRFEP